MGAYASDALLEAFKALPDEKRGWVFDELCQAEGSWGDLADDDVRKRLYARFKHGCPVESPFADLFKTWLEAKWAGVQGEAYDPPAGMTLGGRSPERFAQMARAESAFRDFHYAFREATEERPLRGRPLRGHRLQGRRGRLMMPPSKKARPRMVDGYFISVGGFMEAIRQTQKKKAAGGRA